MILTHCTSSNQLIRIAKERIKKRKKERLSLFVRYPSSIAQNICHFIRPPIAEVFTMPLFIHRKQCAHIYRS